MSPLPGPIYTPFELSSEPPEIQMMLMAQSAGKPTPELPDYSIPVGMSFDSEEQVRARQERYALLNAASAPAVAPSVVIRPEVPGLRETRIGPADPENTLDTAGENQSEWLQVLMVLLVFMMLMRY